jgi:hypothetical protein
VFHSLRTGLGARNLLFPCSHRKSRGDFAGDVGASGARPQGDEPPRPYVRRSQDPATGGSPDPSTGGLADSPAKGWRGAHRARASALHRFDKTPHPKLPSPSSLSPGRGKRGKGDRVRGVSQPPDSARCARPVLPMFPPEDPRGSCARCRGERRLAQWYCR